MKKEKITKEKFTNIVIENYLQGKEIVLFNIGTQKVNGDSFGPLLGSMLEDKLKIIKVYGTLNKTITAINILEQEEQIRKKYKNLFLISTDACTSNNSDFYNEDFILNDEGIKPRSALDNTIKKIIGNVSIKFGIPHCSFVNMFEYLKLIELNNVYNKANKAKNFIIEIDNILYDLYCKKNVCYRQEVK